MFNNSQTEQERIAQIELGRRLAQDEEGTTERVVHRKTRATYDARNKPAHAGVSESGSSRPEFKAKGHDAVLKAVQDKGVPCKIKVLHEPEVTGKVIARDRYTISVMVDGEHDARIYYKQQIVFFQPQRGAIIAEQAGA